MGPHKHSRKRMISSSSSSSNNISSGDEASNKEPYKKRLKYKTHRNDSSSRKESVETRKSRKIEVSKEHSEKKIRKEKRKQKLSRNKCTSPELPSNDIPLHFMEKSKSMAPMTKDEWDKKQSVIQKVYDESTGRHRLIKGDGEVIEEMVSRERHIAINQHATKGDGVHFQNTLSTLLKK